MDSVHAPELPTAGRAIDLEGWALHVARAHASRGGHADLAGNDPSGANRNGSGGAAARDAHHAPSTPTDPGRRAGRESGVILSRPRMDLVARVLWSTATAASVLEVDRSTAVRDWFDDLALGRVVLPAHALVLPEGAGAWRGGVRDARPVDLLRLDAEQLARTLAVPRGVRADGAVVRERARWMHPALRSVAGTVDRAPFVHGWINLAAFVEPVQRSAFSDAGRYEGTGPLGGSGPAGRAIAATGAVDWVGLRAAVRRCVRLFDGLLEVHGGRVDDTRTDLEWRRIGVGVAGLGAALARLGVDLGSTAAAQTARRLALCVTENAHRMSVELGQSRGVFPRFAETLWAEKELLRRHGLVTCSWTSDGLLAASGLGEGVIDAPHDDDGRGALHAPALLDQVRVQIEVQRAFEGVAVIELAVGANHDGEVFERIARERDVQAVRCVETRTARASQHADARNADAWNAVAQSPDLEGARGAGEPDHGELRPAPRDPSRDSSRRESGVHASDAAPNGRRARFAAPHSMESDGYTIAPALRLDVRTERGPWRLDVVYDEDGARELELVLVSGPPGPDGWRLVDGVNAALRDGAPTLTAALDRASPATPGAADLATVLRRFAARDRIEA